MHLSHRRWPAPALVLGLPWLLGACASFAPDGGFAPVAGMTQQRTGQSPRWQRSAADAQAVQARVAELLAQPLSADAAIELALINNRGLQARFAELGIAEADRVRAGRLANPSVGFTHLRGGGVVEIDRSLMVSLVGLLTMSINQRIEGQRFEQAQFQAAADAVGLATETRRAFYRAVAAQQLLTYQTQVRATAEAADQLAQRMLQAGNFSALTRMRQQAFHADAQLQWTRAQQQSVAERERLLRLLGIAGDPASVTLAERLPELPAEAAETGDAEQTAMAHRLDVLMARRAAEATAAQLGLTRATRFVNVLEVGFVNKSQSGEPRQNGYEVTLELPLFDFGAVRNARAESTYSQALHRAADIALRARSEVRESHAAYRSAYALARRYRDEIVPLRRRIADENLLRYNGMLISVFELLADAREQVSSVAAAIEAQRDFWLADADLQAAVSGRSPTESTP